MSTDVLLGKKCPHLILEEVTALGSDRRSLVPRAPVASSNVLRVLAGDQYIPPSGLFAPAQIASTAHGPFRIPAQCVTDLVISASTETRTFTFPPGRVLTLAQVLTTLQQMDTVAVEAFGNGMLLTDTGALGTGSSLRLSGTATTLLGFQQVGARGRQEYPRWELADRVYPRFVEPVRLNPVFKLTYTAPPERCPRCGGSRVENDYLFDFQGNVVLVEGADLLYQAALKILLTRIRSNPFHPTYGSNLTSRIGTKATGAVSALIQEDVQRALNTMQESQRKQAQWQVVTAAERLYAVRSVQVTQNANDPTAFAVDVLVANASNKVVSVNIVFTVPGVTALPGTNGLSL